jgi:hypothetical protein
MGGSWSSLYLIQAEESRGPSTSSHKKSSPRKTGKYSSTSGMITQPPGTNCTPLWGNESLRPTEDGYGIMTAQATTYSKSKMGKSIIISLHQIIVKQGQQ